MARQFDRKYRVRDGFTKLDERFLNGVFSDLDLRIDTFEQRGDKEDAALQGLVRNGLTRIDEYLRPAYENIASLAELGFLTATLLDDAPVTFALGTQIVLVNEGPERDQFRPSPFLTFQVGDDYQKVGIALTTGYNRENGVLGVDFIALTPSLQADPGPHFGIYISSSSGSVVASILALADVKTARDTTLAARTTTVAVRDEVMPAATAALAATVNLLGSHVLGAFPTIRRDGSALQLGDTIYDSTNKYNRNWNGTNWQATETAGFYTKAETDEALSEMEGEVDEALVELNAALDEIPGTIGAALAGSAVVITANHTAVVGGVYHAKTTAGAIVFDLPPEPVEGNTVVVFRNGANTVTLARNGKTISGLADNLLMSADKTIARLVYTDDTWRYQRGKFA